VQQPQLGKVFAFPNARSSAANAAPRMTPVAAPAPQPEPEAPLDEDTLELGEGDELLLDNDDILTSPVASAPIAPPTDDDTEATEGATPAPRETGTLFERMSNIARGAAQAKVDEEDSGGARRDPLDIPRFLNRQNNQ
jgi:cell division protein FtsZ